MPLLKKLGRVSQLNGTADILINEDSADVNYYLQRGDSGKVLFIEQDDDIINIYLPPASAAGSGWYINMIIKASSSEEIYIYNHNDDDNNIHGIVNSPNHSDKNEATVISDNSDMASDGTAQPSASFRDDCQIGDRFEIFCDGTSFYFYGWSADIGAVEV